MKRDLYQELLKWKNKKERKPLILRGARQVGKTTLIQQFANQEFDSVLYVNFEERRDVHALFSSRIDPKSILEDLLLLYELNLCSKRFVLVFDEIQACPDAITSLKYFCEQMPDLHIVAAGSLLGVKLGEGRGFPVGKVQYLDLYPMSFKEFLMAINQAAYRKLIESGKVLSEPIHEQLLRWFKEYLMVGGMPEAVKTFVDTNDFFEVRAVQQDLLNAYQSDFAKYSDPSTALKILTIWKSIPKQLAKETSKFLFSVAKKGARAREYESALIWLEDAGLIHRIENTQVAKTPLSVHKDRSNFKVYLFDCGLLATMAGLSPKLILDEEALFGTFKGVFVENAIFQELIAANKQQLAYWTSQGTAEVDVLLEEDGLIFPLEVKAGKSKKAKSLSVYSSIYNPKVRSRVSKRNLVIENDFVNYPLYAISRFPELGLI